MGFAIRSNSIYFAVQYLHDTFECHNRPPSQDFILPCFLDLSWSLRPAKIPYIFLKQAHAA